jgi:serine/threonine protein kinase
MSVRDPIVARGFRFAEGEQLAGKYEVRAFLGAGWEGEVYLLRERRTGIERAAKFFFPRRNPRGAALRRYARKLHRLRHCSILIRYHTQEVIDFMGTPISFLVSDFVEGDLLGQFLRAQPGRRLDAFQALHLLHALARGVEEIHEAREYHGDLHADNIIVSRRGLGFDLKLIDLFHRETSHRSNVEDDLIDMVHILYKVVGGRRHYASQPPEIKDICKGLRRDLILARWRSAEQLRRHLETLEWVSR